MVPCTVNGEITILGVSVKGSYQRGNEYYIKWELWSCELLTNGQCYGDMQGIGVYPS